MAILVSLWIVVCLPFLAPLLLTLWVAVVYLDVRSTWRIYRFEPEKFSNIESNVFFVALYERLGFKKSVPAFLALVEIPRFVFIALFLAPLVGAALSLNVSYFTGVGVAAAAQGYAHLYGWRANKRWLANR